MKHVAAVVLIAMLSVPGVALAGSSTDAALGLGAFAVFNQILGGTGVFGGLAAPAPPQPVVIERYVVVQQPVVVAPPPPVYYQPAPVYYQYIYVPARAGWGPPGHFRHGRGWGHRHHDDD